MLERIGDLRLDPVISDQFYVYEEAKDLDVKLDFPLPPDLEHLQEFFASPDGESFKKGLAGLVDGLAAWANKYGLNSAPCEKFKETYVNYAGADKDVNKLYIALYQEGVPALGGIVKLIDSESIQLDYRKDKIRNLLASIQVCAPGTHTNITDTYLDLLAYANMPAKWMAMRRKISEQLVLELIKPVDVPVGMEIHYVNAVINRYSDALAIHMIKDPYVSMCPAHKLNGLIDKFAASLQKHLTAEAVIGYIRSEPEFDLSKTEVTPDKLNAFERRLDAFGTEEERAACFSVHAMLAAENDEAVVPYRLSWYADYVIFASLFNRMLRSGYFNAINPLKFTLGGASVNGILEHSLKLASVDVPPAGDLPAQRLPFIPYFINGLVESKEKREQYVRAAIDNKLSRTECYELIEGLSRYLNSFEFDRHPQKAELLAPLVKSIHEILLCEYNWHLTIASLPEAGRRLYLDGFGKDKLAGLIRNMDHLAMVLKYQPAGEYKKIVWEIPYAVLQPILSDGKKLTALLGRLDMDQRAAFLQLTGPAVLKTLAGTITDLKKLPEVMALLPAPERSLFLNIIDKAALIKLILDYSKYQSLFADILNALQPHELTALLLLAGPETVRDMQPGYDLMLRIIRALPAENRASFLLIMQDPERIVCSERSGFSSILLLLPEYARPALLQKLGTLALLKVITTFDSLHMVLTAIPEPNRLTLLHQLGAETNTKLLSDAGSLLKIMSLLPANSHTALIAMGVIPVVDVFRVCIKDDAQLAAVTALMAADHRFGFCKELGAEFLSGLIKDAASLATILNLLPKAVHADFYALIKDKLKTLVADKKQLVNYIQTLPESGHKDFVNAIGSNALWGLLKNAFDFVEVLAMLPFDRKDNFILLFTPEFLLNVYKDKFGLTLIMKEMRTHSWGPLFDKIGADKLLSLIGGASGLGEMLKFLPESQYGGLVDVMKPGLLSRMITNHLDLKLVCETLPADKANAFYVALGPELMRGWIHNAHEFIDVFHSRRTDAPRYLKHILIGISDESLRRFISDRYELMSVLALTAEAGRLNILERLGNAHLETILLQKQNLDDVLSDIRRRSPDESHHNLMLLATLRAYREQRARNPEKNLHWYGRLFQAPERDAKLAEVDKLDAVIQHADRDYFTRIDREQGRVLLDGRLGEIAGAFRKGFVA